ncbi:MAG: hypothetical protein HY515_00060, partial [Candidatus Aenigmarchaeota archaeon]|nr:hypothetical protein [Candidatus Aenigmarchaeota archaeon]
CTPKILRTPVGDRSDEFSLGTTNFSFDNTWDYQEKEELHSLYEKAYPILADFFGDEPVDRLNRKGVAVDISKRKLEKYTFGRRVNTTELGDFQRIELTGTDHETAIHELGHVFWGSQELGADLYHEGFAIAASHAIGMRLGEDYRASMRKRAQTIVDPSLFNKSKVATYAPWDANPNLQRIRMVLTADAWSAVHEEDNEFFAKFKKEIYDNFVSPGEMKGFSPFELSTRSFRGNFADMAERHKILGPPADGNYVMTAPGIVETQPGFVVVTYAIIGARERVLPNVPVNLTIITNGVEYNHGRNLTSELGGVGIPEAFFKPKSRQVVRVTAEFDTDMLELTPASYR